MPSFRRAYLSQRPFGPFLNADRGLVAATPTGALAAPFASETRVAVVSSISLLRSTNSTDAARRSAVGTRVASIFPQDGSRGRASRFANLHHRHRPSTRRCRTGCSARPRGSSEPARLLRHLAARPDAPLLFRDVLLSGAYAHCLRLRPPASSPLLAWLRPPYRISAPAPATVSCLALRRIAYSTPRSPPRPSSPAIPIFHFPRFASSSYSSSFFKSCRVADA